MNLEETTNRKASTDEERQHGYISVCHIDALHLSNRIKVEIKRIHNTNFEYKDSFNVKEIISSAETLTKQNKPATRILLLDILSLSKSLR